MKRLANNAVAVFVVVIVLLLIIPLSPFMLDVMIIINIAVSMMILLISMNIKEPLEFSIFPSLLLVTTLFRIGINVSSTKNILQNQGQAGAVIKSMGDFVLQGNVIVGFVVFIIIVLVQFIVITKGAERVAEVAARFNLDAMPGKQMAIDADLSAGLINEQEAKERRGKIQREADFYGAMDGATKIVKGDAVMSIIITAVNLIGGSVIGLVQSQMELTQVLQVYSIATVGDGLVSQIPALLISTATGMIVTRAVSEGSLNTDVTKQFLAQPRAIIMTGAVLMVLLLVPGMPKIPLALGALSLIMLGYRLHKRMEEGSEFIDAPESIPEAMPDLPEEEYFRDINNIYSLIEVEPIEMEFGYSLIPLIDETTGGKMIDRIVIFRRQFAQEMGFVVPSVRLRDSANLNTNQYVVKVRGEEVAKGEILVDHYLALEPSEPGGSIDGIETLEPAYGIPSKWILPENREMAEVFGYTVIDPLSVMITHLSETIRQHAYELLNRKETMQLLENIKQQAPELVEEVVPGIISYGNFQKILVRLLKEGIPIKDMETILETIADSTVPGEDIYSVTEKIRGALKRTITRKFCEGGQLRVVTLDSELEKELVASLAKSEGGAYLAVRPEVMQSLLAQLGEEVKKFQELSQEAVVLTSQVIRAHLYQLLEQFYPSVHVLAFNEIAGNVQIQAIDNITM
ncbi:flagellar biosynthesis protein FlhA [Ohessyouella blattaphilus]|uniref:Flagellar biosynthesis protein FlhA n=1 Tax=Ohessyouella blattaphilus TaxID=2949333 RepID=A0ABT1EEK0_9FIRM|nr:flagellar biosynthesis protein FlhA [Ohessyouella blattaphilus]MCP1109136.1 flagellar biosynthesis protein FlhA [Ohessyouella blattaphilus]MCR8562530.1 flagellar biosynthesis protein FlhA [Ohessyouella blattaphilus]